MSSDNDDDNDDDEVSFTTNVRIFSSPLTIVDCDNLVLNYLANTPVYPDAPWFCYLLVNKNATRGAHTVIGMSQWPFQSVREHNHGGRRRIENDTTQVKFSEWRLAQIIGPFSRRQDGITLCRIWEDKSRGTIPRVAKGGVLASHFGLSVYVDINVIYRKSVDQ